MKILQRFAEGGYHLGTRLSLDPLQRRRLYALFETAPEASPGILAGRRAVVFTELEAIGPVAVKHYARGGMVRHVNRRTYLHWPRTRGESEFRWLETVRGIGVAAPQPIAFAATGRILGECWLVTAAIPGSRSLMQLPPDRHRAAVYTQAAAHIRALIVHGIWHRDLHPGNILVDCHDTVHLIDFDKARYIANRHRLAARYVDRWQRAIAKHGLAPELAPIIHMAADGT